MKWNALVYLKQMMKYHYNSKETKQSLIPKLARQNKMEQANKEEKQDPTENKTDSILNKDLKEVLSSDEKEENKGTLLNLFFK